MGNVVAKRRNGKAREGKPTGAVAANLSCECEPSPQEESGRFELGWAAVEYAFKAVGPSTPKDWAPPHSAFLVELIEQDVCLFGLAETHGPNGMRVADFVRDHATAIVKANEDAVITNPVMVLRDLFESTQSALAESELDTSLSGTTLTLCLFVGDRMYLANVGNSSCCALRRPPEEPVQQGTGRNKRVLRGPAPAEMISFDHVADELGEMERVINNGGRVEPFRGPDHEPIGPKRLWLPSERVPGLRITRCFGNNVARSVGLISEPAIVPYRIGKDDEMVVVGSSGLWDVMDALKVKLHLDEHDGALSDKAGAVVDNAVMLHRLANHGTSNDLALLVLHFIRQSEAL